MSIAEDTLYKTALDYHRRKPAGKLSIKLTKPTNSAQDLSLAYSPGVAAPVLQIAKDRLTAYDYTAKGNLVGIISNGSAILGLGNLGSLASKPVMEGKAVLFKRFANIDAFDLEVNEADPDRFVAIVQSLADTFGGINLEDIKAPECFYIEKKLQALCDVPIFHDDQHGTAIVTLAALLNALLIQRKKLTAVRFVLMGAGAAAIATIELLLHAGADHKNILLVDSNGVVYEGRKNVSEVKAPYAVRTAARTLADACVGADVFLGFSVGNMLTPDDLKAMASRPIVFACANPDPEMKPELARVTRSDVIMATGRSDYPNQVNNVLAFPYIFAGALQTRASQINMAMKVACAKAISKLVHEETPPQIRKLYKKEDLRLGADYIIPKPMDPRLLTVVGQAVAQAAQASGVARVPRVRSTKKKPKT